MTKPLIAIVANQCELAVGPVFHDHPLTYVPQFYIDAVQQAGGVPVVLPLTAPDAIAQYITAFDGFLLTGGQGVSPFLYGEEPLPKLGMTLLQRDQFEIALVKAVVAAGKPLLGVCRGMQVLNVALGGTLWQNLIYRQRPALKHLQAPTPDTQPSHRIDIQGANYLSQAFGKTCLVNSLHQQALKAIALPLEILATSADGVVEAVQSKRPEQHLYGVQWHPEMLMKQDARQLAIFEQLIQVSTSTL